MYVDKHTYDLGCISCCNFVHCNPIELVVKAVHNSSRVMRQRWLTFRSAYTQFASEG